MIRILVPATTRGGGTSSYSGDCHRRSERVASPPLHEARPKDALGVSSHGTVLIRSTLSKKDSVSTE